MYLLASFVKWATLPLWYLWAGLNDKSDLDLDITLFFLLRLHLLCLIMTIDGYGKNVLKNIIMSHLLSLSGPESPFTTRRKPVTGLERLVNKEVWRKYVFLSNISDLPFFRDRRLPDHKDWMCGNIGKPARTQYVVCMLCEKYHHRWR